MPQLKRVDCSTPGITRRRQGRGFSYRDPAGALIADPDERRRLQSLGIPPAWRDVWICPVPNGHLQATGVDAAGRKQYLYHPEWRARQDQQKFDDMVRFARALPQLRSVVAADLARADLDRRVVLACAVRLLDIGFFRIGSEDYAARNESYGLATMRKEHITVDGNLIIFDYTAKHGKRRVQALSDEEVVAVVARLKRRRQGGPELLAYKEGRSWRDVRSNDINAYVKEATGDDFSAKDFRTWSATVLAAIALAVSGEVASSPTRRKRAINRAIGEVAHYLGNTPAVCRDSYIDPRVIDAYRSGLTLLPALQRASADYQSALHHPVVEAAVLDLIDARDSSPALAHVA